MTNKLPRQQQKLQTRHNIINAAFTCLHDERSLSSVSLREVARVAGIAPTSFYRHFKDINELGLTLVDEAGLALRQLMRSARKRINHSESAIDISVDTFFEYVTKQEEVFRLLLRERTGTSADFRAAVQREIQHFADELGDYIVLRDKVSPDIAVIHADAMVKIVFSAGAEAIGASPQSLAQIKARTKQQLIILQRGLIASYKK